MDEAAARAARTDLGTPSRAPENNTRYGSLAEGLRLSYPWNDVALEIDRLSRSGKLCIFYKDAGDYAVTLPPTD